MSAAPKFPRRAARQRRRFFNKQSRRVALQAFYWLGMSHVSALSASHRKRGPGRFHMQGKP